MPKPSSPPNKRTVVAERLVRVVCVERRSFHNVCCHHMQPIRRRKTPLPILGCSGAQNQTLLGHDRAGPSGRRIGGYLVHKVVIVTRIVVEDD